MGIERRKRPALAEQIVGRLMRQFSTAVVLFHHAAAQRLGIGPADHKCLDLLRERGAATGSELAAITGLTTGAITGVVARLERAGYLSRVSDPRDGRKQILPPASEHAPAIHDATGPIRKDVASLLESFDSCQLSAIADFLARSTEIAYRHVAVLRSDTLRPYPASKAAGAPGSTVRIQRRSGKRK